MIVVAALLATGAVLLLWPAESIARLQRLDLGRPTAQQHALPALSGLLRTHGRARQQHVEQAVDALASLAAELDAGQHPDRALLAASAAGAVWPTAAAAARMGGDIAAGLDADAHRLPVLRQVAACWRLGGSAGAGLAPAFRQLAASARQAQDLRSVLDAELASPRATMRLLGLLPLLGIALGIMLGADPVGWLLGGPFGWAALTAGLCLNGAGAWWAHCIVASVERRL